MTWHNGGHDDDEYNSGHNDSEHNSRHHNGGNGYRRVNHWHDKHGRGIPKAGFISILPVCTTITITVPQGQRRPTLLYNSRSQSQREPALNRSKLRISPSILYPSYGIFRIFRSKAVEKFVRTIEPYENNQPCRIEAAISRMSNISMQRCEGRGRKRVR